jgi:predicted nucleotidyltransferase
MDIYNLKWTRLQNEIFGILCKNVSNPLSQREIARKLDVSPTAVSKSLKELTKQKIAKISNYKGKSNLTLVELERDNEFSIELKRVENLKKIYETRIINFLEEKFPGTTIILFGSYSYGEDAINSDIDIAIIGSKEKEIDLSKFESILEKEINVNIYENFKEINKNLKDNILNGIVLKGRINL